MTVSSTKNQHFKAHNVMRAHHVSFVPLLFFNDADCKFGENGRDGSRVKPAVLSGSRILMLKFENILVCIK